MKGRNKMALKRQSGNKKLLETKLASAQRVNSIVILQLCNESMRVESVDLKKISGNNVKIEFFLMP